MNISPTCDVETYADFIRYYSEGHLPLRNGRQVFNIVSQLSDKAELVLGKTWPIIGDDPHVGYKISSFKELQPELVFSRINGGLACIQGAPYVFYMPRNRATKRGFNWKSYAWRVPMREGHSMGQCDVPSIGLGKEHFASELARLCLLPERTSLGILESNDPHFGGVLDDKYSVFKGMYWNRAWLYWMDECVGSFDDWGDLQLKEDQKWRIPLLKHSLLFSGRAIS